MFEIIAAAEFIERVVAAAEKSPAFRAAATNLLTDCRVKIDALLESAESDLAQPNDSVPGGKQSDVL